MADMFPIHSASDRDGIKAAAQFRMTSLPSNEELRLKIVDLFFEVHAANVEQALENGSLFAFSGAPVIRETDRFIKSAAKKLGQVFIEEDLQCPTPSLKYCGLEAGTYYVPVVRWTRSLGSRAGADFHTEVQLRKGSDERQAHPQERWRLSRSSQPEYVRHGVYRAVLEVSRQREFLLPIPLSGPLLRRAPQGLAGNMIYFGGTGREPPPSAFS